MPPSDDRVTKGMLATALGFSRRDAIKLALATGGTATGLVAAGRPTAAAAVPSGPFRHGLASGDPGTDRVVLWTRITTLGTRPAVVRWQIATTSDMGRLVRQGVALTSAALDWTVKVDAAGLQPGTAYWYRFSFEGESSPVGRTSTLPAGALARLRLAVFSCSNYEGGYFNAYREAARLPELDLVLHLGDYIYEYGDGLQTPATAIGAAPIPRLPELEPRREILTLSDYRTRHALYKSDPDLQELHARCPWIAVWDDHETTNDGWTGGAQNHNPGEGSWQRRKAQAIQAYYEWMPLREPADRMPIDPSTGNPDDLYRSFEIGDLARLIMLDTRLAGRDRQLALPELAQVYAGLRPDTTSAGWPRTMLGQRQEEWLAERLATSRQPWQLVGNQILAFYQNAPDIAGSALTSSQKASLTTIIDQLFGPGAAALLQQLALAGGPSLTATDAWTGYPTARARLLAALAGATNPVVLTGDSHNAWTANLKMPTPAGLRPVAVELGGTSVSSPGLEQYLLGAPPDAVAALLVDSSARKSPTDKLIFSDAARRGFLLLDVTPARIQAEHVFVSTVFARSYTTARSGFEIATGMRRAVPLAPGA